MPRKPKKGPKEGQEMNPEKYKELGNEAFEKEEYEKAIEYYSQAIDIDGKNAVYYSNRATAKLNMDNFQSALEDAEKALTINPNYLKAILRKATCLYELDRLEEALTVIEDGRTKGELEDINILYAQIKEELGQDNVLPKDDENIVKLNKVTDWLANGNSEFSKLKIRYYSKNYRGVHCKQKIKNKEIILFIPKSHLITLEMAKATNISKKVIEKKVELLSPKHSFLSIFLLLEKKNPDSYWRVYLDILPSDYNNFPIFFTEQELGWLDGSPFANQVKDKLNDIKKDFKAICDAAPEMSSFELKEFCWARMTASSRIFGLNINEVKTDAFVPFADLLNHRRPKQTSWSYCNKREGFVIESLENIKKGDQVYDSYGKKCNSRFFLNYGFIVSDNDANEVLVRVNFFEDDPTINAKNDLMQQEKAEGKNFRIVGNYEEQIVLEFFAYIRFVVLQDKDKILHLYDLVDTSKDDKEKDKDEKPGFKPTKTPPLDLKNEKKMIEHVRTLCKKSYSSYKETLKEDIEILEKKDLTPNQRNCVLLRKGEKEILLYFIEMADKLLPLFDLQSKEVKKMALQTNYNKYSEYINKVICTLILKKETK